MTHNFGTFRDKPCKSCGFDFTPYHPKTKYCCDTCRSEASNKQSRDFRKRKSSEYIKDQNLRYNYGITFEDYSRMVTLAEGKCQVCLQKKRLVVDHCHTTGIVRGLLCHSCNVGIGLLGDNEGGLEKALSYLKKEYG